MALSDRLITKVDDILTRFAPPNRTAYKRTVTRTGGDAFLGRSVAVSDVDELLEPQPFFSKVDRSSPYLSGNDLVMVDDWFVVFSINSITREEITDPDVVLVLVDENGVEETLRLIDLKEAGVSTVNVAYLTFYRSTKRS